MILKSENIYLNKILENNKELYSFVSDFNFSDDFEEMKIKLSKKIKNASLDIFGEELIIYKKDKNNSLQVELSFNKDIKSEETILFERVSFSKKIEDLSITYFINSQGLNITIGYPEPDIFGMPIETTINLIKGNINSCKNLFDYSDQIRYENHLEIISNYKELITNEKDRTSQLIHERKFLTEEEKDIYNLKYDIKVDENDLFHLLAFDINEVISLNVL